jgi:hypothetical protein
MHFHGSKVYLAESNVKEKHSAAAQRTVLLRLAGVDTVHLEEALQ